MQHPLRMIDPACKVSSDSRSAATTICMHVGVSDQPARVVSGGRGLATGFLVCVLCGAGAALAAHSATASESCSCVLAGLCRSWWGCVCVAGL